MFLSWKGIDKLEAVVPGANTYRGERCEFTVLLGRGSTPLSLTGDDCERFRIENKELDIMVEGATLNEAKQLLREKLASSDNFSGTWLLWMRINAHGGYEHSYGGEQANCTISVSYVVELTTKQPGQKVRRRHIHLQGALPCPFTGEFWRPSTHAELARLREGAAVEKRDSFNRDEVWCEATPEIVATVRQLQKRLGESGEVVKAALSKTKYLETLAAVRDGTTHLLSAGAEPTTKPKRGSR